MAAGFGIGVFFTLGLGGRYAGACPWMLGVFSLGMFGALISHCPRAAHAALRNNIHWGILSAIILVAFLAVGVTNLGLYRQFPALADTILGLGVMALLIALAGSAARRDTRTGRWIVDLFSSRPARTLGGCSYSLYLLHYPLLILSQALLVLLFPTSLYWVDFMMLVPVMAAIIGIAYLFSLAFERPFMGPSKKRKAAGAAAPPQEALAAPKNVALEASCPIPSISSR
jgi:peptidoglycan/LPS O-acetylase OafA/YrhL